MDLFRQTDCRERCILVASRVYDSLDKLLDRIPTALGSDHHAREPWAYQQGLCVAAGKPFLGHEVRPSTVLYYDQENGSEEILQVSRALCGHLGIKPFPENFLVIPNDGSPPSVECAVVVRKPGLVIVDTLRALHREAERDNSSMGHLLQNFRRIARENHCAILLLHHTRSGHPEAASQDDLASLPVGSPRLPKSWPMGRASKLPWQCAS